MFKRRQFLQLAGSTLATYGLSHLHIQQQANRYGKVLAQTTPRKLALLVGINNYPTSNRFINLKGATTDVLLQKELLIHRFGFKANDIKVLTTEDSQHLPTRDNILTVFEEHLIAQAQRDDVVVFHFSGHGSRINDPIPRHSSDGKPLPFNSTFVPTDEQSQGKAVDDIMGKTLFLLISALQTENVTVILDCCYSGGGTRAQGNVRFRFAEGGEERQPSEQELAYQERWRQQLGITPAKLAQQRDIGVAKGVVIASAQENQKAIDASIVDFHAGIFTYLMTQYLWQQTETINGVSARVTRELKALRMAQTPFSDLQTGKDFGQQPLYFLKPIAQTAADAVITKVEGNRAKIWLGGVPAESLATFEPGATLGAIASTTSEPQVVTLLERRGLVGIVSLPNAELRGTPFLKEESRLLPDSFKLRLGIDPSLTKAEQGQVKQAIDKLGRFEALLPETSAGSYAAQVQYILGRATPEYLQGLSFPAQTVPALNSVGLFYPSLEAIVPDSFGLADETVSDAITHLTPKLRSLLAARLVKLTLNAQSSRLDVEAWINLVEGDRTLVGQAFTARGELPERRSPKPISSVPYRALLQFNVKNNETTDLYLSILVIDEAGNLVVLFPNQWKASEQATRVQASETVSVGKPGEGFQIRALTRGREEALIIASRKPLTDALLALRDLAREQLDREQRGFVVPTLDTIDKLLTDLSRGESEEGKAFDTQDLATLSITFEVA